MVPLNLNEFHEQRRTSSYGQFIRSKFGSWIAAGCCYAVSDLFVPVWIISMWCILIPHSICHFHLLDILWICFFLNRNPVSSLSLWASALFCITYYNNFFIIFVQYRERCAELPLWACRAQDIKLKVVHISIFGACLGLGPNPATVSSNFGGFHGQWFNNGNSYWYGWF